MQWTLDLGNIVVGIISLVALILSISAYGRAYRLQNDEQRYSEFLDGVFQKGLANAGEGLQKDVRVQVDEAKHIRYLSRAMREGLIQRYGRGDYVVRLFEPS